MTVEKLKPLIDDMNKQELIEVARKFNLTLPKIKNIFKLTKQELKIELLMNAEGVYKMLISKKQPEIKKREVKKMKLNKDDENKLFNKILELGEEFLKEKDETKKKQILKEKEKLEKKIKKNL